MITICGGKWTTYRHMAEDCVNQAATLARLAEKPCVTGHLNIHGFHPASEKFGHLWVYGSDASMVQELEQSNTAWAEPLDASLPYTGAEVVWAVRHELALTLEDVLARRTRALFLNAQAALRMAPRVAALMAQELGRDCQWQAAQLAAFSEVAKGYLLGM
jgi:glycerol-3-phosphate dehydrogenase